MFRSRIPRTVELNPPTLTTAPRAAGGAESGSFWMGATACLHSLEAGLREALPIPSLRIPLGIGKPGRNQVLRGRPGTTTNRRILGECTETSRCMHDVHVGKRFKFPLVRHGLVEGTDTSHQKQLNDKGVDFLHVIHAILEIGSKLVEQGPPMYLSSSAGARASA